MPRNPAIILSEIRNLVDELELVLGDDPAQDKKPHVKKSFPGILAKGSVGSITILIEEGFFDTPKEIASIMGKLKEIGHSHKKPAVSMSLLNLTRKRILTRSHNENTKKWEYVKK